MTKLILGLIITFSGLGFSVIYFGPPAFFGNPEHGRGGGVAMSAPEIDPSSAMSALTLLLGGVTVLRSRSRK